MLPKVSIIIPYKINRGWLYDCVRSIMVQTYQGQIEIILSSSDNGVSNNINRCIQMASGDYIKFIAEDDMLTPNCIEDSVKSIQGFDAIHGNAYYIKDNSIVKSFEPEVKQLDLRSMLDRNHIHGGTLMYKSEVLKSNLFNESLWTGEEYELNLRLLKKGFKFNYCDSYMTYNRLHEGQKSIGNKDLDYQRKRSAEILRIKRSIA